MKGTKWKTTYWSIVCPGCHCHTVGYELPNFCSNCYRRFVANIELYDVRVEVIMTDDLSAVVTSNHLNNSLDVF